MDDELWKLGGDLAGQGYCNLPTNSPASSDGLCSKRKSALLPNFLSPKHRWITKADAQKLIESARWNVPVAVGSVAAQNGEANATPSPPLVIEGKLTEVRIVVVSS